MRATGLMVWYDMVMLEKAGGEGGEVRGKGWSHVCDKTRWRRTV